MVRRVFFAAVWCVVLYIGACFVTGGVAGAIATANLQPGQDAAAVGGEAGARVVGQYRSFIGMGAVAAAILGTYYQILPGTRE